MARIERADAAERDLLLMLRAPFDTWGNDVLWQLVMCEFALLHLDDVSRSPKQLQLDFRKACLEARQDVPRVHGSMQIDALQDALDASKPLRTELALHALPRTYLVRHALPRTYLAPPAFLSSGWVQALGLLPFALGASSGHTLGNR